MKSSRRTVVVHFEQGRARQQAVPSFAALKSPLATGAVLFGFKVNHYQPDDRA